MQVESAEKPALELKAINEDSVLAEATPALFRISYAHEAIRPRGSTAKLAKAEPYMEFVGERILRSPSYRTLPIARRILEEVLLAYQSVHPFTGVHTYPGQVKAIQASIPRRAWKLLWYINHYEEIRRRNKEHDPYPGPHNEQELFDISNLSREEEPMSLAEIEELYPIEFFATSGMPTKKSRRAKRSFKECPQCHRRFLAERANQVFDRKACGNKYARLHPKQTAPAGMMLEPANAVPESLITQEL
jgi:ribosomal protein L37AE/L43A